MRQNFPEQKDRNRPLLFFDRSRIEIAIHATQEIGQEGKEVELHRQTVPARGHQVGFEGAQRLLRWLAAWVAEFFPSCPPAGAQHVEPGRADLREVALPDINVGALEK